MAPLELGGDGSPEVMVDDIDIRTQFDLSFLSSPLRQLDVLELLGTWDSDQPESAKRLRLSASLTQSKRMLQASAGAMDFKDLVAYLESDGSAKGGSTTSSDLTVAEKRASSAVDQGSVFDFINDEVLCELREDEQAMRDLTAKIDLLSQDYRLRASSRLDAPVQVALSEGGDVSLDKLRVHFRDRFANEVELQVKQVAKRKRANLHPKATGLLTDFVNQRLFNPYATQAEKEQLALACDITVDQVRPRAARGPAPRASRTTAAAS